MDEEQLDPEYREFLAECERKAQEEHRRTHGPLAAPLLAEVLKLATLTVSTKTLAQDRWGNRCGVEIYALRIGQRCVLLSHFPDVGDPESPPETTVEKLVPLRDAMRQALELFRAYYASLQPRFRVQSAFHLADKTTELGALLDHHYTPTEGVKATQPSAVLPQIASADFAECPRKWAWFNDTLYLTDCVFRRTGLLTGGEVFDRSLAGLLRGLKFAVHEIRLCNVKPPGDPMTGFIYQNPDIDPSLVPADFRGVVELSLKLQRRKELEREIDIAARELHDDIQRSDELRQKIDKLKAELTTLS